MSARWFEHEAIAVASEYAEAALDLAAEAGIVEPVGQELDGLVEAFDSDRALREFLVTPLIPPGRKTEVLERRLAGRVSDVTRRLLGVLVRNGRGRLLPALASAYRDQRNRRQGKVEVSVTSAAPLDQQRRRELIEALRAWTGVEPLLTLRTDPALVGGIRVMFGDEVIDASVRAHLDQMRAGLRICRPRGRGGA